MIQSNALWLQHQRCTNLSRRNWNTQLGQQLK
uniref:50S ribosomal protein L18 n=1 Tax=Arundo donax TaxID=35708 RepID=A0A0A9ECD7_ARUDO